MTIEAYFSHSWRPKHVPINSLVWNTISNGCDLYVDSAGASDGTYYVNRLEELIRRSDAFVSVLTFRDEDGTRDRTTRDYAMRCSEWALFELRLAERARKPRWVVYDTRTRLDAPRTDQELVLYTPMDEDESPSRIERVIRADGERWLASVGKIGDAGQARRSTTAALLLDDSQPDSEKVSEAVRAVLDAEGYVRMRVIRPVHTDAEVISILQSCGLLVAEVNGIGLGELYGMAHAMFIPTIRFLRDASGLNALPRILDGHPGGYQHDLLVATDIAALCEGIRRRAAAMRDRRRAIRGVEAEAYFRSKLYRKDHNIFVSHNLSNRDAGLLQRVFEGLRSEGIRAWEYRERNEAGDKWEDKLSAALGDARDFVFILADGFETSRWCMQ